MALTTWGPLVLQLAFPWIYAFGRPWPRRITVLLAMSFHLGILVLMGLNTFALIMIGAELLLLSDADVQAIVELPNRLRRATMKQRPNSQRRELKSVLLGVAGALAFLVGNRLSLRWPATRGRALATLLESTRAA